MGKLTRKILGNVAGAVGDITFSDWNGQTVIKAKSEGSKSAPTPAQLLVREKFKVMTGLANAFTQVIPLGLDGKAEGITKYNVFRRINYPTISGAVGALVVDNAGIVVSRGKLEGLNSLALSNAGQNITVNWNYGNYGVGTDQVTLVAYNPVVKQTVVNTASIRSGGTSALAVPAMWATQQVFVYIFTGNGNISSTSQFAGSVTV
jgi:hypothetical protein